MDPNTIPPAPQSISTPQPTVPTPTPPPAKPNNRLVILITLLVIFLSLYVAGFFVYRYMQSKQPTTITTYVECIKAAGSIVQTSYPAVCVTRGGKQFSQLLKPEEQKNENPTKIYCKNPRPEVCTLECAQTPPYICGSDDRRYCSVCQACSNKDVVWYELRASACGEELLNELLPISDSELSMGWYFGTKDQKKPNTPASWIYTEGGKSSCWHKSDTQCGFLPD